MRVRTIARELSDVLTHAGEEGLQPQDYSAEQVAERLEKTSGGPMAPLDPKALAEFDILCTIAALTYMSDVFDGRISPKALDAVWVSEPRKGDLDSTLVYALRHNRVKATLQGLAPTHDEYRKLREARARFAELVEAGGWKPIPSGPPLKKGAKGPRVQLLKARLAATGYIDARAGQSDVFDGATSAAVQRMQNRYGRTPDGVVGAPDLAALNVPVEARIQQIELNMERWRWLPEKLGDPAIMVNIPDFMLHVVENGRPSSTCASWWARQSTAPRSSANEMTTSRLQSYAGTFLLRSP